MKRILEWLKSVGRPSEATVTPDAAREIARSFCVQKGWPCEEPIDVVRSRDVYEVRPYVDTRGGEIIIDVNVRTGEVERDHVTPL